MYYSTVSRVLNLKEVSGDDQPVTVDFDLLLDAVSDKLFDINKDCYVLVHFPNPSGDIAFTFVETAFDLVELSRDLVEDFTCDAFRVKLVDVYTLLGISITERLKKVKPF